jgi:predicted AAA+ superfamily ATPase
MMRDVVERHEVTQVVGLRWLVRHLMGNAAGMFSVEKFYKAMKSQALSISKDTVHQLVGHLEDSFLIRTVWVEADSERRRMVNPRKAYPVDPGLIPLFDRTGRANVGHALETAVLIELERRHLDVTYVRTPEGLEVDFLARGPDGRAELIQVAAYARDATTAARELRALTDAGRFYPKAVKRLLTLTRDGLPDRVPNGVVAQPAYEWMLAAPEDA